MFKVPPAIAAERLTTCKACKHFVELTQSCGTLILGNKLSPEDLAEAEENNRVTHYRKKTRLCGCRMPVKTKYALARCPINKWGRYKLTDEETELLNAFISGLPTQGVYTAQMVKEAAAWFTKMTGQRYGCSSCKANTIFQFLKDSIREADVDDLGQ
jgi:hypothetical protein